MLHFTVIFFSAFAFASQANVCKVVSVADGDTLTVRCDEQPQEKIRLADIDAPERGQPYGNRSRESLADLCAGKQATIKRKRKDLYGRTLAEVACQDKGRTNIFLDAYSMPYKSARAWREFTRNTTSQ